MFYFYLLIPKSQTVLVFLTWFVVSTHNPFSFLISSQVTGWLIIKHTTQERENACLGIGNSNAGGKEKLFILFHVSYYYAFSRYLQ